MTFYVFIHTFAMMELSHYCVDKYKDRTGDKRTYWQIIRSFYKGDFEPHTEKKEEADI